MSSSQVETNEIIVRRYLVEGWGEGREDILLETLDPDCRRHLHGAVSGGFNAIDTLRAYRTAFPDAKVEVELLFGKDDLVVCRSTTTGTHKAPYMGFPASQKLVSVCAVDFFRLADGKIVESWHNVDEVGLRRALGQKI